MSREKISKYLLSSCNKMNRKKIEEFLYEGSDEKFNRNELIKIKFYNHLLFSELDIFNRNKTLKKGEDTNILKRLFTLGYDCCQDKMIEELSNFNQRYLFYKELKFSQDFIIKDLEYSFKNKGMAMLTFEILVNEVEKRFPDLLENYLASDRVDKVTSLVLMALKQKIQDGKKDKIVELEQEIINVLCRNYSKERVENILNYDLGIKELKFDLDSDGEKAGELVEVIKSIYSDVESENREYILKLIEILTFPDMLKEKNFSNEKTYSKYINESKLPFIYKLVYLYQSSEKFSIFGELKTLVESDIEKSIDLLERMCEQNIELGSIILSVLLREDILAEEDKSRYLNSYRERINLLISQLDGKKEMEKEIRILNTLGYMLTFMDVEVEIKSMYEFYLEKKRDLNEFINIISNYEMVVGEESRVNPWEIAAKITNLDKKFLIVGTLEYVVIKSEKEFTEFVKKNEEIFYELLEKNVFKDYHSFSEMMQYTYRTETQFNVESLMSYLSTTNEEILELLFEILKTKEKECSLKIVELAESKNKVILKNIEKLKRVWEGNRTSNFNSIVELEEYCKEILQQEKRDIPYLKSEVYKIVREKDSDRLVDETVIKLYVSLHTLSNEERETKFGKKIREFLNERDLRKCIKTLLETWIDNKMPEKYIGIVKVFSFVADDFMVDEFLTQCENLIKKGKSKEVLNILLIMVYSGRRDIFTLLQHIQNGLQNPQMERFLIENASIETDEVFNPIFENRLDFSLGFDKIGVKVLDYGKREIKLVLNRDLNVSIYNQEEKELKSLPKFSNKFEDEEKRVEFYQKELKRFKKRKEYLVAEAENFFVYQMIGNREWREEEWKEELLNDFLLRYYSNFVIWCVKVKGKQHFCTFDLEKGIFIDIVTEEEIREAEIIKVFYSGEVESEKAKEVEKKAEKLNGMVFDKQFKVKDSSIEDLNKFKNIKLSENKIVNVLENELVNYIVTEGKEDISEKLIILDKVNRVFLEMDIIRIGKTEYHLNEFDFYTEKRDRVKLESIDFRFRSFVSYIFNLIK